MTQAVLLDLGNVVLGVDFHRVFKYWAQAANVDESRFYENWSMDATYEAHERGTITFSDYSDHLSNLFEVHLPEAEWLAGWNAIWTTPFAQVIELLPAIAERYPLYCFTNTNESHATYWQHHYKTDVANFKHIFISNEIGMRKPDVPSFHAVCQEMNVPPSQVTFLDDSKDNIAGAHEAGLMAHHVESEEAVVAKLEALLQTR